MTNQTKKKVFSGVKPSGELQLGNYLGAIRNWALEAEQYDNIFCVVDMHAITVPQDPKELHKRSRDIAKLYISAGLDPQKVAIFIQSHIKEHTELGWIFQCLTPMGWAYRMTQFKEKSADARETVSVGLLAYPMLMASDILLYQVNGVPVGEDQKQHVELTRDLAEKFNREYGETFVVPEPYIKEDGARIMSLDNPTKKMSKSLPNGNIELMDPPDKIRSLIMKATTDSGRDIIFDEENKPGVTNLLTIFQLLHPDKMTKEQVEAHFAGKGYGALKKEVAEVVVEGLRPLQQRFAELSADPNYIEEVLKDGADRIRPIAEKTVNDVKTKMGLG